MSSRRCDDLVSMLNSLGFYTENCRHYSNGNLTVERAGSELVGMTIEQLADKVSTVEGIGCIAEEPYSGNPPALPRKLHPSLGDLQRLPE